MAEHGNIEIKIDTGNFKDSSKAILLWEDNNGVFNAVDAELAIPELVAEMRKNLETYRTVTIKIDSAGGSIKNV